MREVQNLVEGERENKLEQVNFVHADEDAEHAGGADHADGARSSPCGREKVRCGCVRRLAEPPWPKFTRLLLVLSPRRSGVDYEHRHDSA